MTEGSMMSKFPFSMENLPRQQSFACLSLKFGCIVSALTIILYSVFAVGQCAIALGELASQLQEWEIATMAMYGLVIGITITHAVTLLLSALMLVGVLSERMYLIRPWVLWVSIQVTVSVLLFVFWSTMSMINQFGDGSLVVYVFEFLLLLIRFYMLMIVGSYYKQLQEEKGETERLVKLINSEHWYNA